MSWGKLRLSLLAVGICFCLILIASVDAQLNFSTGWGKRSNSVASADFNRRVGLQDTPNPRTFSTYYRRFMKIDPKRHVVNV
ncbi:PREDICTED: uncharacterized protein LOC105361825 [Ceratosolen solmsi marchali]|uniref:Uncharacterized protein LOC105361825 n=1 Tax=Ceratosolen solmsi marchali TaxID=326594 RepID=A0AAJ6YG45_9HYME|nr:PREDICTED: uncharacterized protein LOC105361825 [Ceratosolen solmsi marchali]